MIHQDKIPHDEEIKSEGKNLKPDFIPEKFWDEKTKTIRVEALAQSYIELEKKLSNTPKQLMPPETDEDKINLLKMLGRPESADEYDVDVSHGLFEKDSELNKHLHDLGFTQEQVQAVYDAAADKLVPLILEMSAEFQADREVERLIQEFGGVEKWQEVSRQLLAFGQKNLPEDVLESLANSHEGVMTLFRMMKGSEPSFGSKNAMSGSLDEAGLQSMMRDPKYWRDKDPSFVAKVTQGFEGLYS